jgi:hypothetical protein
MELVRRASSSFILMDREAGGTTLAFKTNRLEQQTVPFFENFSRKNEASSAVVTREGRRQTVPFLLIYCIQRDDIIRNYGKCSPSSHFVS